MSQQHLVLVVEDDSAMRDVNCKVVESLGYEYTSASNCETATQKGLEESICCAILDLTLPDGNGMSLIPTLLETNPCCTFIILTGDSQTSTITDAIHEGVSDFLLKPVTLDALRKAINRALHMHEIVSERNRLHEELLQERESLRENVQEAVGQLQEQADRLELTNTQNSILLKLRSLAQGTYTEEQLFGCLCDELSKIMPLQCLVLSTERILDQSIVAVPEKEKESTVIVVESSGNTAPFSASTDTTFISEDDIRMTARTYGNLDLDFTTILAYPQHSMGQSICAIGFIFPAVYEIDSECESFLNECANAVTAEWLQLRFLDYSLKQALVGNLALDQSRIMVQELTAIRTNVGMLMDTENGTVVLKSLGIIDENAERLGQRLLDLRGISSPHKNITETVYLDNVISQVLNLLDNTIEEKHIAVQSDFSTRGCCTLFNGTALASTFLDLISNAIRTAGTGGVIDLKLTEDDPDKITFDISHDPMLLNTSAGELKNRSSPSQAHPKFIMAQRTIQVCGGSLSTLQELDNRNVIRVSLPKNAIESKAPLESVGGA